MRVRRAARKDSVALVMRATFHARHLAPWPRQLKRACRSPPLRTPRTTTSESVDRRRKSQTIGTVVVESGDEAEPERETPPAVALGFFQSATGLEPARRVPQARAAGAGRRGLRQHHLPDGRKERFAVATFAAKGRIISKRGGAGASRGSSRRPSPASASHASLQPGWLLTASCPCRSRP